MGNQSLKRGQSPSQQKARSPGNHCDPIAKTGPNAPAPLIDNRSHQHHQTSHPFITTPPTPQEKGNKPPPQCLSETPPPTLSSSQNPSLQKYTARLRSAPLSHVAAFLILHELTAVVPLVGLFGVFHYTQLAPVGYMLEHYGGYVRQGTKRFEGYFRRKGWFGFVQGEEKDKGEGGRTR
ncbi:hypothetical protein B0T18DRAFT_85924 [Schizothecium vesticola]|uniref:Uncharacterized protein n=1 Tax=Schizothecium vesticola TaxID=314040 RepID=A0AA40F6S7_9PEZI|nr:hypothetical protein B0T18DRAFT_85924 [Schizothecium vesticola]